MRRLSQQSPSKTPDRISRTKRAEDDPYFIAIKNGDLTATEQFLAEGRTVEEVNEDGLRPLRVAAAYGQTKIMEFLVKQGALVEYVEFDASGNRERLPIHDAAKGGHAGAITFLANNNSPLSVKDGFGIAPLHLIAGFKESTESKYWEALIALCASKEKVDLDATDVRADSQVAGRTPLHLSILNRHELLAVELVKLGARMDTFENQGISPFLSAHRMGLTSIIAAMLDRWEDETRRQFSADPRLIKPGLCTVYKEDGTTLFHLAALMGDDVLIERFCTVGVGSNPLNRKRQTPLFLAARNGHTKVVSCLLNHGGNPNLKPRLSEKGPLEIARKKGHQECVVLLEKWFEDPANEKVINPPERNSSSEESDEGKDLEYPAPTETAELTKPSEPSPENIQHEPLELSERASKSSDVVSAVPSGDLSDVNSLDAGFLSEHSQIVGEIKACFEPHMSSKTPELSEFLSLLDSTAGTTDICNLSTKSGKNLLHLMAEYDPKATLLATLKKFTPTENNTLLLKKTTQDDWPFHTACEHQHPRLFEFCLASIELYGDKFKFALVKKIHGKSLLRISLEYRDFNILITKLLEQKHLSRKYDLLFELMSILYAERPNTTPRAQSKASVTTPFWRTATAPVTPEVKALRKQLLFRVFHRCEWPEELIEAMVILIGCPISSQEDAPEITSEERLLCLIKSNGANSPKQASVNYRLVNHVILILALSYQVIESKGGTKAQPKRGILEAQYLEQFRKRPEEMLRRVEDFYDYLYKIDPKIAKEFLTRVVYGYSRSDSILTTGIKAAFAVDQPTYWWNRDVKGLFMATLVQKFAPNTVHQISGYLSK